jgi:hypothetical protein
MPPRTRAPFHQPGVYNSVAPTLTDGQDTCFQFDINGNLKISGVSGGSAADGSTTTVAGGPAFGRVWVSAPTGTDNGYYPPRLNTREELIGAFGERLDAVNDAITSYPLGHSYIVGGITTATTTVVRSTAGVLAELMILGGTLGNITVYDNGAASGNVIVPTFTPTVTGVIARNVLLTTGLTVVTAAATIIQVTHRS